MVLPFLNSYRILVGVPIALLSLSVHEAAHGWVSYKLGDPTPRAEGRITLNPMAHLDLMGTILMILTGFGWAKPVSVNPRYYKNVKTGMALTALAGPLSNFLLAFVSVFLSCVLSLIFARTGINAGVAEFINGFLWQLAVTNLSFMVFNLIPIPPLDGFKVAGIFLPNRIYYNVLRYERYSMILIMVLSLTGALGSVITNGVALFLRMIYGFFAPAMNFLLPLV